MDYAPLPSYTVRTGFAMDTETARRPYMRLWIDDIRGSCADMSAAQFGAHMRLLMHAWERGSIPTDQRRIMRIVGEIETNELPAVLERWQDTGQGTYVNPRQERERQRLTKHTSTRADAGRRGANERWNGKPIANGIANGWQTDSKEDGKNMAFPYSHIPILPNTQNPTIPVCDDARSAPRVDWSKADGFTGITDDERTEWSEVYGVDVDLELRAAHQWLVSNPARARKRNWRKFLTNWLARAAAPRAGTKGRRDESHIPDDCHPDDRRLWFMPDGRTPRMPLTYRRKDGTQA